MEILGYGLMSNHFHAVSLRMPTLNDFLKQLASSS